MPSTIFTKTIPLRELQRHLVRIDDVLDRRSDLFLHAADGDLMGAAVAQADVAGVLVDADIPVRIQVLRSRGKLEHLIRRLRRATYL